MHAVRAAMVNITNEAADSGNREQYGIPASHWL
jgi:hypothetical protein